MMLNEYGAARQADASRQRHDDEDDAGQARRGRRSTAQAMALGAPLSAGFLGLLLARGDARAAEAADEPTGAGRGVASDDPRGEAVPGLSHAADGAPPPATAGAAPLAAGAAVAAPLAFVAAAEPAAASTSAMPPAARPSDSTAVEPAAGAAVETTPPPLPDIGDVTLAFGSEAPFVLPDPIADNPGAPDENLGDIGDPGAIDRQPIEPPAEDTSDGDAGQAPIGNPGLRITGTAQNDRLIGTDGDDVIDGVGGKNTIVGGAGDDLIHGGTGNDVLRGGPGNDTIYGREGNNIIYGEEGDNQLFGGAGNDTIYGGTGNDRLDGGAGSDKLYAGTGDDTLVINSYRDVAIGNGQGPNGGGVDTLEVAPGFAASLKGRFATLAPDGKASFVMGEAAPGRAFPEEVNRFGWQVDQRIDNVRLTGEDDHDVVGSAKGDTIWGNAGDNRLYGGDGDDILYAGGGDNRLEGGAGNDHLHAGSGTDQLFGGAGDDVLYGGEGESELLGGDGDDLYVFGLAEGGKPTVFDHQGVNRLRFDGPGRADDVAARLDGDDLVLAHNGADIVRLDAYAGNRDAFAGVELGGEVLPLDQFFRQPETTADQPAGPDDLLAVFLGPQSVEADDILDPAWLEADGPAHDAPFALYETAETSELAQPRSSASSAEAGADDVLGGFMRSEPLWIGPEEGLYVPETAELQAEPHQARG